ncbi:unnamed protein product, partial [Prorocentrum cordatum]
MLATRRGDLRAVRLGFECPRWRAPWPLGTIAVRWRPGAVALATRADGPRGRRSAATLGLLMRPAVGEPGQQVAAALRPRNSKTNDWGEANKEADMEVVDEADNACGEYVGDAEENCGSV